MTVADVLAYARDAGIITMLVTILIGGYRGWWCWGYQLREEKIAKERWQELALSLLQQNEKIVRKLPGTPTE